MQRRARRATGRPTAGAALLVLVLALAGCGGDSAPAASTSPAAGPGAGRGARFAQDPKVRACLRKQGITLPNRGGGRGGGRPGAGRAPGAGNRPPSGTNARPPAGTNGRPPAGTNGRPRGGARGGSAQFAKMRAGLKKCGVQLPSRGSGNPPGNGGAPPRTTPTAPAS